MRAEDLPAGDRREALKDLRTRLRGAEGASFELDNILFEHVAGGEGQFRRYSSSLDGAIALIEDALPGWGWEVGAPVSPSGGKPWASIWPGGFGDERERHHRNAATPALALLSALIAALYERAPGGLLLSPGMEPAGHLTSSAIREPSREAPVPAIAGPSPDGDAGEIIAAAQAASEASAALLKAVLGESDLDGGAVARRLLSAARLVMGPGEQPEDEVLLAALDAWLIGRR